MPFSCLHYRHPYFFAFIDCALQVHYQDLKDKPFFPDLIQYMLSGPVVAMVWQGLDVVKQGRIMLGATNPLASAPGTIRGDYSIQVTREHILLFS